MIKERIIRIVNGALFASTILVLLSFLFNMGFDLSEATEQLLYKGAVILFWLLVADNIAMLFINRPVKEEFGKHKTLYAVTSLLLLLYAAATIDNLGFAQYRHLIVQLFIFYMFLFKLSQINRVVATGIKLKPEQIFIFSFLGVIILGSLLLSMPRATVASGSMPYIDALFTSTSAVCVPGLIVVDTAAHFTMFGKTIILILIQIGGLGLMTFTSFLSIFFFKSMSFRERFMMTDVLSTDFAGDVQKIIGKILSITFTIEILGATLLFTRWHNSFKTVGEALYHSVFHSVSAFCNAGFSTFSNSLEAFRGDLSVNVIVMFLIIIGGLGFVVILDVFQPSKNRKKVLLLQSKFVLTTSAVLIIVGAVVIFIIENNRLMAGMPLNEKILASFFQSVTPRTAGFNTLNTAGLSYPVLFMTMMFMFIGASPGSTGGGVKTTTFGILFATVWATVKNRESVDAFKRRIPHRIRRLSFCHDAVFDAFRGS